MVNVGLCPFAWIEVTKPAGCFSAMLGGKAKIVSEPQSCMNVTCQSWQDDRHGCGLVTLPPALSFVSTDQSMKPLTDVSPDNAKSQSLELEMVGVSTVSAKYISPELPTTRSPEIATNQESQSDEERGKKEGGLMSSQPIWEFPSGNWVQDEEKRRFLVLNQKTGEVAGNQLGLDIIVGAKWHPASESDCGGFFPPEFNHCPFCGKQLASGEFHSDAWVPPFGGGSGLRLVAKRINLASLPVQQDKAIKWVDQEEENFPLPRLRGDYQFIVAQLGTKSPALIAFDRTSGLVDYYSPAHKEWVSFTPSPDRRIGGNLLPAWSWSAAFVSGKTMPGFAVPTREGPVWIALDWSEGKSTPVFGKGESIGGAATLDNRVFIPVLVEGVIAIHSFDHTASQWNQIGEAMKIGVKESGIEDRYFSIPVIDEGRHVVYWVGIPGLLVFDLANCSCVWRPWETDAYPCSAVPTLGPPYRDSSGNYWQICYDIGDPAGAFRYYKLSGDESDREDVDGGRFSSGVSCFSKPYDLWGKPWEKIDAKLHGKAECIRAPLLCIDEESKATITANFGSGTTLPLLEIIKDRGKSYPTDLKIETPGLPIELRTRDAFNLSAPWELRLFIYQQCVFAYSMEEAVCHKWRLT